MRHKEELLETEAESVLADEIFSRLYDDLIVKEEHHLSFTNLDFQEASYINELDSKGSLFEELH